ncbi:MAG: thioredoxin domain-containing protein [Methanomassiliicoccus sp.]|nr:thioredoxin domain-containing protein [Methanomassiliicoccus sp.]
MAEDIAVRELDGRSLQELLASTDKLVVAEFYMDGCSACRSMAPVFDDLARELSEGAVFVRVDARPNLDTALQYGVVATPTFLLFCRGLFLADVVGIMDLDGLRKVIGDMLRHRSECAGGPMVPPFETDGYR